MYTATFGSSGAESVDVPEGTDVYSNPVAMTVTPGENLAVSVFLSNNVGMMPASIACTQCTTYVDGATGDATTTTSATPFTNSAAASGTFATILGGVDVETSGTPTVVTLGNSVTDALSNTDIAWTTPRVSGDLASGLESQASSGTVPAFSVVDDGVESQMLYTDDLNDRAAALSSLARTSLPSPTSARSSSTRAWRT